MIYLYQDFLSLPSRFYDLRINYKHFLWKKAYDGFITIENFKILQNKDPKRHLTRIETQIERSVVKGGRAEESYKSFKEDLTKFISKLGFFNKILVKILVRSAHATVIISFFCAFSDFNKMDSDQIIKAIPVANVFTFWITLNCCYIGHCLKTYSDLVAISST